MILDALFIACLVLVAAGAALLALALGGVLVGVAGGLIGVGVVGAVASWVFAVPPSAVPE